MIPEMSPKVLVIGSSDHGRASCFDWSQPLPNIEEYDSVILNMQTLTQNIYNKIYDRIFRLREPVTTVFTTNREIFCILNKVLYSPVSVFKTDGSTHIYTSYDWIPVIIRINEKNGISINLYDHRFDNYFEFVKSWNYELDLYYGDNWPDVLRSIFYQIRPIASNLSRKTIAGSIRGVNPLTGQSFDGNERGAIHLLPPTTKCDIFQAIEIILDIIHGEETKKTPLWRKNIEIPQMREPHQKIGEKIKQIQELQQEISELENQIKYWDSYRDLLTETGNNLENIVQRVLADIGIKTERSDLGFPADLISKEFAVEVTGIRGCVGTASEKVNQTGRFKESYHKGEKITLVANTHMDLSPEARKEKMDFSPEVRKYFESLSVCCLTAMTLFQLWKDVVLKKRNPSDVKKVILMKNGELTLDDFKMYNKV
jgi:hypothetical protein